MTTANDRNASVIEAFRSSGGNVGGDWAGRPLLLLTTTGAKSGRPHTTPVMFLEEGDRRYVFASMGGAPKSPAWYHNLVANSTVTVEAGGETYEATATPVTGEEHDRIYAAQASKFSNFADYQARTTRTIPVVALERRA